MVNIEEIVEKVLSAARGELTDEEGLEWVEGPGETYLKACEQLWQARQDLCARTGISWEDPALEQIMNAVDTLERDLCRRMFHAGIAAPTVCSAAVVEGPNGGPNVRRSP